MAIIILFQTLILYTLLYFTYCTVDLKELIIGNMISDTSKLENYYALKIPDNTNEQDLVFDIYSTDEEKNTDPDIFISTVKINI